MNLTAITLFVEDLPAAKEFYARTFAARPVYEDPDSAVFKLGGTLVNLLRVQAAPELIAPAQVGSPEGVRAQYTLTVDDVDATVATLQERGIALLNGPIDRPWGVRTASFRDPAGHVWEIAK